MSRANAERLPKTQVEPGHRVFTGRLFRVQRGRTKVFTRDEPIPPRPEPKRPLRVARMLALAHRMQAMLDSGEVEDQATLARRLGFSRARVTQLLDLLLLAPDIQEEILFTLMPPGRDPVTEHGLRGVVRASLWAEQLEIWAQIRPK
jgi:hypothetical protein